MKNSLQKWLDSIIFGNTLYFAGISATAVAAGVSAAATAATAASSLMGSDAQQSAAGQATAAGDRITAEQMRLADQSRQAANAYQQPYYGTGTAAQNKLAYGLGITNEFDTPTDTSYQAYSATMNKRRADINLQLKALKTLPKNPKLKAKAIQQRAALQKQLNQINANIKAGQGSAQFQAWQSKQPGTKKTTVPIDGTYGSLMADNPEQFKFEADPGYAFRKEIGERDLNTRLASMGLTNSGAALKQGMEFNQGLGAQEYQSAWQRYLDRNNMYNQNRGFKVGALSDFANTGQQAANTMSANQREYGNQVTGAKANQNAYTQDNITGAGNARAAGYVGAGKALMNGANSYLAYKGYQNGGGGTF